MRDDINAEEAVVESLVAASVKTPRGKPVASYLANCCLLSSVRSRKRRNSGSAKETPTAKLQTT